MKIKNISKKILDKIKKNKTLNENFIITYIFNNIKSIMKHHEMLNKIYFFKLINDNIMKKLIIIFFVLSMSSCTFLKTDKIECATILDKDRIVNVEDSYYLIYTDKGEFTIKDNIWRGNFKSSKWYGSLKINSKYNFKVDGFRSGILSLYQNMITSPIKCK